MIKPYYETELGKLYHGDCLEIMPEIEPVDLVITSPPYGKLRDYKGYNFVFNRIAHRLYQAVKSGGVAVWVVGDETIDGSESGESFRQALYFKEIGFNLHDTMIYEKNGAAYPANDKSIRYSQIFEFMFVFSKGKPKTINLIRDKKNNWAGFGTFGQNSEREKDGQIKKRGKFIVPNYSYRNNIWLINNGFGYSTKDKIAYKHPAIFPESLARDHIISWSNEGDTILDPMCGSGTVPKMCERLKRKWLACEISEEYCEIAAKRIENERKQLKLF